MIWHEYYVRVIPGWLVFLEMRRPRRVARRPETQLLPARCAGIQRPGQVSGSEHLLGFHAKCQGSLGVAISS
jgi:hypothetical protein